jgi:uridine kinase
MRGDSASAQDVRAIVAVVRAEVARAGCPLLVALDGGSGAGKSTLAAAVGAQLRAAIVDGDDFYAGGTAAEWDARTPAANADHCIDWRRLRSEALEPLLRGCTASWHPYDWRPGGGLLPALTTCDPSPVVVLDGAYSARPELDDLVGLAVLVDVPADERRSRVMARESPMDETWFARWDAAERHYFTHVRPGARFDLVVSTASAAQPSAAADRSQRQEHQDEPADRQDR